MGKGRGQGSWERPEQSKPGQESSMGQTLGSSLYQKSQMSPFLPGFISGSQKELKCAHWEESSISFEWWVLSSSQDSRTRWARGKGTHLASVSQTPDLTPMRTPTLLSFNSPVSVLFCLPFSFPNSAFSSPLETLYYTGETFRITGLQSQLHYFLSSVPLAKSLSLPKTQSLNL